jgi:heme exporter protein A
LFSDLSFSLTAGSLTYLSGPNGAGKTSLLRMLVGFVEPSEGHVLLDGENIAKEEARRELAMRSVYIGHKSGINPQVSAIENSRFWCQLQGIQVSDSYLFQVLATLGLVGLEDLPCGQLSAGQNRRVALARLWFKKNASMWILDEPFTALDVSGIKLLEEYIQEFINLGGAVIMTSHQPLKYLQNWQELSLEYQL